MDMHLMDQKGSRISATIGNQMVSQFEYLLKEGGSLNLSNFYVVNNNAPYKVANHPFKINFHKKTKEDQVVDVIRLIFVVGDVFHEERKWKKNRRMVVELTDIDDDFKTRMEYSSDHIKVCIFQFGSVRKYENSSRLLARVGDDTSSLQVSNLTSESIEALEEKSFFYGTKYVNLEQLMDVVEPCACQESWKRKIRNTYKCETCGPDILHVIPKFRVQVRVSYDSVCASFLMFDRDVFSIIDRSAVDVSRYNLTNNYVVYNLTNNYVVYTVGRMTSSELHIKSFIKLYADGRMQDSNLRLLKDEVKDVNEDGYETDGDNEEPILETTQNPKPKTSTPSKVEPVEFNATPLQGKRGIANVDKDKGAQSVTSINKRRYCESEKLKGLKAATRLFLNEDVSENHAYIKNIKSSTTSMRLLAKQVVYLSLERFFANSGCTHQLNQITEVCQVQSCILLATVTDISNEGWMYIACLNGNKNVPHIIKESAYQDSGYTVFECLECLANFKCVAPSDEDITTTPSPITKSSSHSPPNAPSKTPSTKDTSSTFRTTSSSFKSKPQASPPTSSDTPSPQPSYLFLENGIDAPSRPSHLLPLQSHPSLDITLSLLPITPLDHILDTPSPP
uniref:Replication protein A 70 kDa DNA-binding subunit C-like n=1 Tax=Tanacetum cinerariifolium TaxID=118510 RepID=A0A6L2NMY1_TANCI|nr:replication protein A 70 kDa DNA-binding subunit C-like [Tanacetum cinerariifolium]